MGKSTVAAAYARAAIEDATGPRVVVWVSGESQAALLTGLGMLAQRAGLGEDGEDGETAAARARDYLSGLSTPAVLVVDNAENAEQIQRWLPAGPACHVLITSTDQVFSGLVAPVQVGPFSRNQSITYLLERTGLNDRGGADQLADALGDLPLALGQAAGVITMQHLTYTRYLAKLTAGSLTAALPPGPGYPRGLAEAIQLSVDAAVTRDERASMLLAVLSVLDPNGVTRALLDSLLSAFSHETPPRHTAQHEPPRRVRRLLSLRRMWSWVIVGGSGREGVASLVWSADEVDEAIAALAGTSLITVTADRDAVVMHRLVGRYLRETCSDLAEVLRSAAMGLERAVSPLPRQAALPTPELIADTTSQALALLTHTSPDRPQPLILEVYTHLTRVCDWLYNVGAYTGVVLVQGQTSALMERVLGPEHANTLASRTWLAVGYAAVGRHQEAVTLHEATLATQERVLGPEHPATLVSRSNLAKGYWAMGR